MFVVLEWSIEIIFFVGCYMIAWYICNTKLFPNTKLKQEEEVLLASTTKSSSTTTLQQPPSRSLLNPRVLFCITFAVSCSLLQMVVLEFFNVFEKQSKYLFWKIYFYSAVALLQFILPFYLIYFFLHDTFFSKFFQTNRLLLWITSAIGYLITLYGFYTVMNWLSFLDFTSHLIKTGLDDTLANIFILGVFTLAMLSGYGSINLPFQLVGRVFLFKQFANKEQMKQSKAEMEQRIDKINTMISSVTKKKQISSGSSSSSSMFDVQVMNLERVKHSLQMEMEELNKLLDYEMDPNKLKKYAWNVIGIICSGYSLYRILKSIYNLLFLHGVQQKLGENFNWKLFGIDQFYAQLFSFVIVSIIIALSIRNFWMHTQKLLHYLIISSESFIIFFAEISGIYFLTSLLLLYSKIPLQLRHEMKDALNLEPFVIFFAKWNDILFLISATFTFLLFYTDAKLKREQLKEFSR